MELFRAFSLIDSSRLLSGQNPDNYVKVNWVCYLRDEPLLPFDSLIEDYHNLPETSKAKLWILDEPFTTLDAAGVKQLEALLRTHAGNGGAVMVTTHHTLSAPDLQVLELG